VEVIKELLMEIDSRFENCEKFEKELERIIKYINNKYEYYIKEILGTKYLSVKNEKNICCIKLKYDIPYLTQYEFVTFRYSLNLKKIEAFRTREVSIISGDEDLDFIIKEIEKKLHGDNYFNLITKNYKSNDIAKDSLIEKYNKLLKENGFKTQIVQENILRKVNEILFFTKYKNSAIEPNVTFALWKKENDKINISSLIYMSGKLDVGDFYSYETVEDISSERLELLII